MVKRTCISAMVIFVLFCVSCGENVPCDAALSPLHFVSFSDNETDTIIVRKFVKGGNFGSVLDTTFINKLNSAYYITGDTLNVGHSFGGQYGLSSQFDYEIYLPEISRTFRISGIVEESTEMRIVKGPFSMDRRGCSNPVKSYMLNGQLMSGNYNYAGFYLRK